LGEEDRFAVARMAKIGIAETDGMMEGAMPQLLLREEVLL
jgi:hypothetical protein